jgi:hypothetical protein
VDSTGHMLGLCDQGNHPYSFLRTQTFPDQLSNKNFTNTLSLDKYQNSGVTHVPLLPVMQRLLAAVSANLTGVTSRTVNLHSGVACSSCKIQPEYIDFASFF